MKNRIFTVILVLVSIFLAILWVREQSYRARINRLNTVVKRMEHRMRGLQLRADALEEEIEMLNLSTYVQLMKGWKRLRP